MEASDHDVKELSQQLLSAKTGRVNELHKDPSLLWLDENR